MKERRKYERFRLVLPTRLARVNSEKRHTFALKTRDISASGVFLQTEERFPKGTRCQLEMTVPSERIKELTGVQSLIKVEGVVVRSTPDGVAICFDGGCQILGLKGE